MIDNATLAHNFAHNKKSYKSSNNMHFYSVSDNNRYCYSYSTIIAAIVDNVCYISNCYCSHTTQKHIAYIKSATSHLKQVFCAYPTGDTSDNFKDYEMDIKCILRKLAKARKPERYLAQIADVVNQAKAYAKAKGVLLSKELQYYSNLTVNSRAVTAAKKQAEAAKAAEKARLQKWLSGANIHLNSNTCYLRYIQQKGYTIIETSKSVKVNIATALEFARKLLAEDISTRYPRTQVAGYTVTTCNNNTVKIGCHTFKRSYLNTFAKNLIAQYA